MRDRLRQFAGRIIRLVAKLPDGRVGDVLGRQILKSGTSIGANYREALRASSKRHFTTLVEISLREADETCYWLDLLSDHELVPAHRLKPLTQERHEIVRILAATVRTAKGIPRKSN
ncbi:MAG: four helix bundle protein [Planctomycetia bacterium]|nr:four helix bundle protein [Planctomycetia bacterium]